MAMALLKADANPAATFGIRPQDIEIGDAVGGDFPAKVILVQPQGRSSILVVQTGNTALTIQTAKQAAVGDTVGLRINRDKIHIFNESGAAIVHGTEPAYG